MISWKKFLFFQGSICNSSEYNEDYWIAGVFVVIEAALITTAVVYDNKGDDQTEYFESYADDYTNPDHNWSVVRYAEWLVEYEYNNDHAFE
jgi:hypothetical protein